MNVFNMSESNISKTESPDFQIPGFSLLVVPGNAYVIWLIVTGAGNGVAAEFFSLNLSVCEILFCLRSLLSLASTAYPSIVYVVLYLLGITINGRPLFQCLICVECYLAVVHPTTFLKYRPLRYKVICSTAAWIMITIASALITANATAFQKHLFMCFCLCQALLTLSVKLFCCLALLRALKRSGPGERRNQDKAKENHVKRRAFNFIVMIIMAVLLIYSVYLVAGFVYILTHKYISGLWTAGQMCYVLGGLVQPFLYLYRTGKLHICKAQ